MKRTFTMLVALVAGLLAGLVATPAFADITLEKVNIIGINDGVRREQQQEYEEAMNQLNAQMRSAYGRRGQMTQVFTNAQDDNVWRSQNSDMRCNPGGALQTGSTSTASNPSQQLSAGQAAFQLLRNALTTAQFNTFIQRLGTQSGRTLVADAAYSAPVWTIVWTDGSQTSFALRQGGSGWSPYATVQIKAPPSGEGTGCPS